MDARMLAALEEAIEPYRRAGFIVTSQSEGAITLTYPPERFSYLLFIILLLIWPLAVLYLIFHNNQRGKSVCLRITSRGHIEVSGYTLEIIAKERKRRKLVAILLFSVLAVTTVFIVIRLYWLGA